jgi:hypothetical protein
VRVVGTLDADEQFHGGDRRDGGVVSPQNSVDVQLAALDRDQNAGVEYYSPGQPRTSPLNAERRST